MSEPKIIQVQTTREELPVKYADVLAMNPLLARIDGQCRSLGWTDQEIRTIQLLAACRSNVSLMARVKELESLLTKVEAK